ncbi:hypothetical protein MC885_009508 [Smutsia gigantea]|nr:hypothetical protein MC885_009508 [Smutsia gigantea]
MNELKECLSVLVKEQQVLAIQSATTTLSALRLQQRLVIVEWYFIALSRAVFQENFKVKWKSSSISLPPVDKKRMFMEHLVPKAQAVPLAGSASGAGCPAELAVQRGALRGAVCRLGALQGNASAMAKSVNLSLLANKDTFFFSQMLSAILLLLKLWDRGMQETDE